MKMLSMLLLLAALPATHAAPQAATAVEDRVLSTLLQRESAPSRHASIWEPAFPSFEYPSEISSEEKSGGRHEPSGRSTAIPLQYDGYLYFGEISLGTPPQTFRMTLSMIYNTVWIPNFPYTTVNRYYNHSQSSTYTPNGTAYVMKDFISGFLSQDTMRIGDLEIENQGFVEINAINSTLIPPAKYPCWDGIFGLGFGLRGDPSQIKMPFHSLVDSGVLKEPLFSLYLNKDAGNGVLTIGDVNASHYTGELAYAKVVRHDSWTIELDDIRVGDQSFTQNRQARVWTGWHGIQGPKDDVAALAEVVGAKRRDLLYEIDCSSPGPDIEIMIGGARFVLSKSDYTGRVIRHDGGVGADEQRGAVCLWEIQDFSFVNGWTIGDAFLETVYSVFYWGEPEHKGRDRKVGFAPRA